MENKPERLSRPLTSDEKSRHAEMREKVMREFPPAVTGKHEPDSQGVAGQLRRTRKSRGLTYDAVAELAGLSSGNTVKDVEYGRNTNLKHIEAIAQSLGMKIELVAS